MAFQHGKSAYFNLDNSSGTPTDLSAYCNSESLSQQAEVAETTTFGASDKTYIPGLKDATFTVEGPWDPTLDAHLAAVLGHASTKTFIIGPQGSTGGQVKYTGECICISFDVDVSVDGEVTFSADFQVSGAVTRTTF